MQCGEIVYEAKRDKNIIHTLKTVKTSFENYEDEFTMILGEIAQDHSRNILIINEIEKLSNRNILVISERIEHLNILFYGLKSKKIKPTLLYGGMGAKIQREAIKSAQNAKIILSTSGYIGEGIDFSHLDAIVFAMPISYPGRIVQYLGRIGRRGQQCLALDFVDENVPMLKSSFQKRLKGYKQMGYKQQLQNSQSILKLFE
jgi:superfamily II DNA or RNA helicase